MVSSGNYAANPSGWNQHFNLLYVDAPGTGFSYILPAPDGSTPSVGYDTYRDAAVVARVILRFLDRHPAVQRNRVVLVGESFGGFRATAMLDQLFHYPLIKDEPGNDNPYRDTPCYTDMSNHFTAVFGPNNADPETISQQFGHQVLIEPLLLGHYQSVPGFKKDLTPCGTNPWSGNFNCGHELAWYPDQVKKAAYNLLHVNNGT
jgi:hypothetical protein